MGTDGTIADAITDDNRSIPVAETIDRRCANTAGGHAAGYDQGIDAMASEPAGKIGLKKARRVALSYDQLTALRRQLRNDLANRIIFGENFERRNFCGEKIAVAAVLAENIRVKAIGISLARANLSKSTVCKTAAWILPPPNNFGSSNATTKSTITKAGRSPKPMVCPKPCCW